MDKVTTEETGKATSEEQDTGAAAAVATEEQAPEKVDLNRIIEGDTEYAAEQLAKSAAVEEAAAAAPEKGEPAPPADADDPVVLVLKNRGKKEEIRRSQAENRIQQAAHLQTLYETEAAPVLKILKSNPMLAQAFADAARGNEQGIKKVLSILSGAPPAGETTTEDKGTDKGSGLKADPRVVKLLRADPRYAEYKDEELESLAVVVTADRIAREEATQEQEQEQEAQLSTKRTVFFEALGSADPELHVQVLNHMPLVLRDLKEKLAAEGKFADYYEFVKLVRDPSNKDNTGRSLLANFYHDVRQALAGTPPADDKEKSSGAPPPAKPVGQGARPALRAILGGRLEPGAPSTSTKGGMLPSLAGKTLEERRALMETLMP